MSRIDKYEPNIGGTRAPLNFALVDSDLEKVWAVGLNANGRIVKGKGNTGLIGILVATKTKPAGTIMDVMTSCDVVEFTATAGTAGTAGTTYYADGTTGNVVAGQVGGAAPASGDGSTAGSKKVGCTVEADRLVVRMGSN